MRNSKQPKRIPWDRKVRVLELACELREKLFPNGKPIDPETALDKLYELVPNFDWFVGNDYFSGMNDVVAYAKFDDGKHIFLSDPVYNALSRPGTTTYARAAFIVCHEIAHKILHSRSRKRLARNKLGSPENYRTEAIKEREANLFAGSLLVPIATLDTNLTEHSVAKHFRTSYSVASICKKDAVFFQEYRKRKGC